MRIRVGIDVHTDESGVKRGDNVLAEAPLSRARAAADRAAGFLAKYSRRRFRPGVRFVQLPPGVDYCFEFAAARSRYALTVWRAGGRKPRPQVVVPDPPLLLGKGSVGVIAHRCGVQVYEFEVEPDE